MPELKSMKLTDEELKERDTDLSEEEREPWPWGLTLHLNDEVISKLDYEAGEVGEEVHIVAKAFVKRASSHKELGEKPEENMCLQITDMAVAKSETDDTERAGRMYPSMSNNSNET